MQYRKIITVVITTNIRILRILSVKSKLSQRTNRGRTWLCLKFQCVVVMSWNLIYSLWRAQCRYRIFLKTKYKRINQYFVSGVRKKDLPWQAQGSKSLLKCRFDLFKMRNWKVPLCQTFLRNLNLLIFRFRSSSDFYILIVLKELGLGRSNCRLLQSRRWLSNMPTVVFSRAIFHVTEWVTTRNFVKTVGCPTRLKSSESANFSWSFN